MHLRQAVGCIDFIERKKKIQKDHLQVLMLLICESQRLGEGEAPLLLLPLHPNTTQSLSYFLLFLTGESLVYIKSRGVHLLLRLQCDTFYPFYYGMMQLFYWKNIIWILLYWIFSLQSSQTFAHLSNIPNLLQTFRFDTINVLPLSGMILALRFPRRQRYANVTVARNQSKQSKARKAFTKRKRQHNGFIKPIHNCKTEP